MEKIDWEKTNSDPDEFYIEKLWGLSSRLSSKRPAFIAAAMEFLNTKCEKCSHGRHLIKGNLVTDESWAHVDCTKCEQTIHEKNFPDKFKLYESDKWLKYNQAHTKSVKKS